MCLRNPLPRTAVFLAALALAVPVFAQPLPRPDWRKVGNATLDLSLASPASGPVERVWYSPDGARLFARAAVDRTFVTSDFENWTLVPPVEAQPVPPQNVTVERWPEPGARVRAQGNDVSRLFAIARYVHRSDDGGHTWTSLTDFRGASILGEGLRDLAVSPRDSEEVVVAAETGVWRSIDGGLSWSGLNEGLPNLTVRRILATPQGDRGVRVAASVRDSLLTFEWVPGEKTAWQRIEDAGFDRDAALREVLSATLRSTISAVAVSGDYLYAGSVDGRIWSSRDRGRTWNPAPDLYAAPVEAIFADPSEPRLALAALGARFAEAPATARAPHILRTINGGGFWDDLTSNLPDTAAHGVAVDRESGAVYAATDRGVFVAFEDLTRAAPAAQWTPLELPVPTAQAMDVRLDPQGHQLYVALEGFGVHAAPAPHRFRVPKAVSAADFTERPAAPGALITVLGANVRTAAAGSVPSPVLAASDSKSEIQVPFEARGTSLQLAIEAAAGPLTLGMPLRPAAPAIFVDAEGAPMILDADSGVMLDAMRPARSNARIQILATGLGRVRPQWPSGMPAPLDDPPAVIAPVRVLLDRTPIEVTRATLAPGYIGFYLIEVTIPKLVNYGPAELFVEVEGQQSNRVRVYIEP
jgi:uncharacterized protein (TIGR03437 family)